MKTYIVSVTASNTITIKVRANGYFEAQDVALDELAKNTYDLFNPAMMSVDINVEDECDETRSAYTIMQSSREDARELCDELNELLGRTEFVISSDAVFEDTQLIGISADELTDDEVKRLNLSEDFIIK